MTEVEQLQKSKSTGHVLLYLRTGEDVSIVEDLLAGMAAEGAVCTDIEDLCRRMTEEDVDAVLLTEPALAEGALPILAEVLHGQPSWSDVPVLFVASGGPESPLAVQAMRDLPNVLILDRPVRLATLAGALRMAVRMRDKQRQVRDLLDEHRRAQEALENANERLNAQADDLAAVNEQLLTEREGLREQSLELRRLKEQAERTARAMENLVRLVEENPDPALRVSPDGRIQYQNPASFQLVLQWNGADQRRVPPVVQEIVSAAYARMEVIRREIAFGERTYVITVVPALPAAQYVNIFAGDITDRKHAEEALRRSEAQFHRLFEDDLTGNFISTPEGEILLCNPAFAAMFGFSRAVDAVGTNLADLYLDPKERQPLVERLRKEGKIERVETWRKRRDGQPIHVVENHVGHFNEQGELYEIKGYLFEDTDRTRAEDALRESEERLRALVTASSEVLYRMSPDWSEMRQLHSRGFLADTEKPSRTWLSEYIHPDDQPRVTAVIQEAIRTKSVFEMEHRVRRVDGSLGWTLSRAVPLLDANGKIMEWFGAASDITDRKRAEEALRESETSLKRAQEIAHLGSWELDVVANRLVWSDEVYRIFGLQPQEFGATYEAFLEHVHPDDRAAVDAAYSGSVREGRDSYEIEHRVVRQNTREIRYVHQKCRHVRDAQGRLVLSLGMVLDITERKRAEEALRQWNATLESKVAQRTAELGHRTRQLQKLALEMSQAEDREREQIAQILHDDLQQELAAAKFHLSIVRSRIKHDPSVQEIIATVDQMLMDAIGKSRNLSHDLSPAVLHQGDLAEILRWLAGETQARHGLLVHVRATGQVPLPSDAIKAFLYRTVQELLFNTVKHAQVNEAKVRVRQCGGYVHLSVSDRGRGFDPGKLREAAGFGLLSIRERIELLGGRMKIRSAPGKGSTFFIVVPDGTIAEDVGVGPRAHPMSGGHGGPTLRVLLADDHDVVREGLASLLSEEEGVEVVGEAANGREAVDLAGQLHPDVVVMDLLMPVMNGDEATRQIKENVPRTRIVALSMRDEPEVQEKMQAAGADRYVLKTAPYKELLAAIRGKEDAL
jgi:PAS domain S-box-containing protein